MKVPTFKLKVRNSTKVPTFKLKVRNRTKVPTFKLQVRNRTNTKSNVHNTGNNKPKVSITKKIIFVMINVVFLMILAMLTYFVFTPKGAPSEFLKNLEEGINIKFIKDLATVIRKAVSNILNI